MLTWNDTDYRRSSPHSHSSARRNARVAWKWTTNKEQLENEGPENTEPPVSERQKVENEGLENGRPQRLNDNRT